MKPSSTATFKSLASHTCAFGNSTWQCSTNIMTASGSVVIADKNYRTVNGVLRFAQDKLCKQSLIVAISSSDNYHSKIFFTIPVTSGFLPSSNPINQAK